VAFEYAPAPESRSVVSIASSYGLFIDGAFVDAADGSTFATVNPATEEVLSNVAEAGQSDVDRAVAAARQAFDRTWGPMSGRDRAKYLFRIARLIQERSRELAVLERTSSITRGGRTSSSTPASGRRRDRWASPHR
jgi:aldehyde dehydrogenase (NAD+)